MALTSNRLAEAVTRKARTRVGIRFGRFAISAMAALGANEITVAVCLALNMNAGTAAGLGWLAGAIVSYVLARWAFGRKGKPHLLKETLPFWIVAVGTAIVLTATTKWANQRALAMDLPDNERLMFTAAAYFLANCVTFLTRFLIFHYILFRDRGSKVSELVSELPASERPGATSRSANGATSESANGSHSTGDGVAASEPFAAAGSASGGNGSSAWAGNGAERSPGRKETALPEPGARR